jgi:hypothetical protein
MVCFSSPKEKKEKKKKVFFLSQLLRLVGPYSYPLTKCCFLNHLHFNASALIISCSHGYFLSGACSLNHGL